VAGQRRGTQCPHWTLGGNLEAWKTIPIKYKVMLPFFSFFFYFFYFPGNKFTELVF
jgi:hypothetical protein